MTRATILAIALGFAVATPLGGHAQEATPAANVATCDEVAPRDANDLQQVAGTPPAPMGTPTNEPTPMATPFVMPDGEEVSEEDLAAVATLYQTLSACLNSGDFLRVYALYSDGYLQRNLTAETINSLEVTPEPNAEAMQVEFVEVQDARYLDEDRIGVLVVTTNPQTGDLQTYAELVRAGEGWLIDHEQLLEAEMATPAA